MIVRLLTFLCLTASLAIAQTDVAPSEDFTATDLAAYLAQAQGTNPELQAYQFRYEAAKARIPQASALPDPMFQVTHFVEAIQTRTGPQENAFVLSQRVPWFGKLSSRENAASAEAEALFYAFQNRQLTLARAVALAYYEYAYTGEAIGITNESLHLLQKLDSVTEERVRAGGKLNTLLRLKVETGLVSDKLLSLEQKRAVQSASLRKLLGLEPGPELPFPQMGRQGDAESLRQGDLKTGRLGESDNLSPTPPIPPSPLPPVDGDGDRDRVTGRVGEWNTSVDPIAIMRTMEANNPELAMLQRQVASAEARREIARLEQYPDFTVGLNYIQVGDPTVNPTTPDAGQDPWGFTVAVNLPIWFPKYNAAKAEALAHQRASESAYADRLNAMKAEVSASVALLNDANRRLALYGGDLLPLARQSVDISRSSYEADDEDILDLIETERALLDLQLLHQRAATDARQQRIVLQTLANEPIAGTFEATTAEP